MQPWCLLDHYVVLSDCGQPYQLNLCPFCVENEQLFAYYICMCVCVCVLLCTSVLCVFISCMGYYCFSPKVHLLWWTRMISRQLAPSLQSRSLRLVGVYRAFRQEGSLPSTKLFTSVLTVPVSQLATDLLHF